MRLLGLSYLSDTAGYIKTLVFAHLHLRHPLPSIGVPISTGPGHWRGGYETQGNPALIRSLGRKNAICSEDLERLERGLSFETVATKKGKRLTTAVGCGILPTPPNPCLAVLAKSPPGRNRRHLGPTSATSATTSAHYRKPA